MAYGLSIEFNEQLGRRIRKRRKEVGLTMEDVSIKIGTTRNRVSSLELGRETPTLEKLYRVADALDCTIHHLLPKKRGK